MDYSKQIWDFLMSQFNNPYAVAGIMGNLQHESACQPCRVQGDFTNGYIKSIEYALNVDGLKTTKEKFIKDGKGWGLTQLTFWSRKSAFYDYCKITKKPAVSIADLNAQLEYFMIEMNNYKLVDELKKAKTVREASNIILLKFEKPKDQSIKVQDARANLGQAYFNKYAVAASPNISPVQAPTVPTQNDLPAAAPSITQYNGSCNMTVSRSRKIEYIVIHYTAGTTSKAGAAKSIATYFNKASTKASADYIVDDNFIVQYNLDPKNKYTWAVGGSKYSSKSTSLAASFYGKCKNNNSISIEMCSSKKNTKSLQAMDRDWYVTDAVVNNTVKLVQYLMKLYNIDINHVITHSMVNGKLCPAFWTWDEASLAGWYNFLAKVKGEVPNVNPQAPAAAGYKVRINVGSLNIRSGPGMSNKVVGTVKQNEVYTIVAEQNGWGKLKSGAGWISLKYTIKI